MLRHHKIHNSSNPEIRLLKHLKPCKSKKNGSHFLRRWLGMEQEKKRASEWVLSVDADVR